MKVSSQEEPNEFLVTAGWLPLQTSRDCDSVPTMEGRG